MRKSVGKTVGALAASLALLAGSVAMATPAQAAVKVAYDRNAAYVSATSFAECNREVNAIAKDLRSQGMTVKVYPCKSYERYAPYKWHGGVNK